MRFVMGWLRSATAGQRCRVVIASNPPIGGEGEWLTSWFASWLDPSFRLAAQLAAPTWRLRGNAIVIESKDDIRKRLDSTTDDADAAVLAWHKRADALRRQMRPRLNPGIGLGWGGNGWMGN